MAAKTTPFRITITAGDGEMLSERVVPVPDELVRPYGIYYDSVIALAGLKLSEELYGLVINGDDDELKTEAAAALKAIATARAGV